MHPEPRRARRRLLRGLGTLCLAASLALSGWLAWGLWGTGLATARVQRQLRASLLPSLVVEPDVIVPNGPRPGPAGPTPPRRFKTGRAVALLRIPRISLDMVVVEGVDDRSLRDGPGHYPGTAFPWDPAGRVAIAGHRTTFLHPFWDLQLLKPGDRIVLESRYGRFTYEVTGSRVVAPTDVSVLGRTRRPSLVLTTCEPRYSASHRLVVFAVRASP